MCRGKLCVWIVAFVVSVAGFGAEALAQGLGEPTHDCVARPETEDCHWKVTTLVYPDVTIGEECFTPVKLKVERGTDEDDECEECTEESTVLLVPCDGESASTVILCGASVSAHNSAGGFNEVTNCTEMSIQFAFGGV